MGKNKFCLYLFLLIALCIFPLFSDLYSYNRNVVKVIPQDVKYVSVKNTNVRQKIYLEGKISKLGITFYAPSGQLYADALVKISIRQNEKKIEDTVEAKKLRVKSPHRTIDFINRLEETPKEEMTYYFNKSLLSLSKGEAEVTITSSNLPQGTDLFCEVSKDVCSGLPHAFAGVNNLGLPLVIRYNAFKINAHFWYETILLLLLFTIIILVSYVFTYKENLLKKLPAFLYIFSFLMIVLIISIKNPYASFWGEPRSEAVYEFWYKSHYWGFFGSLMSLMSGEALAWLERIFMWIANVIFPVKYVFVGAQVMETFWIAFVCSLPCCIFFRKYYDDIIRLAISIFIGCFLFYDSQYFFWSCSYWASVFFIIFALMPMEKLKKSIYYCGLCLTIVLCVSRIYHILLTPIAVIYLVLLKRKISKRFSIWCTVVVCSSLFEFFYSMLNKENLTHGSSIFKSVMDVGILRIIENTFYYQAQVITSFFTGNNHFQGAGINAVALIVFAIFVAIFLHESFEKHINAACYFGGLIFLSLTSIAVNVFVSGSHYEVSFPMNYATEVEWTKNIYQQADLHFSYAYICLVFLLLGILFLAKHYFEDINIFRQNILNFGLSIFIYSFFAIMASVSAQPRIGYDQIIVSWKDIYQVIQRPQYFMAVNAEYSVAPISMEYGTDEYIYGIDNKGKLFQWSYGDKQYEIFAPYVEANIGSVSNISQKKVFSATARRAITNFDVKYVALFKDKTGNVIAKVPQAETEYRYWLDFIPEQPLNGVNSISFELSDGNVASVQNGLQVGYIK